MSVRSKGRRRGHCRQRFTDLLEVVHPRSPLFIRLPLFGIIRMGYCRGICLAGLGVRQKHFFLLMAPLGNDSEVGLMPRPLEPLPRRSRRHLLSVIRDSLDLR